ncbi:dienelactone hydrolase family protein [Sphingomonas solaris]|uniref:Dienelactone hydrolase family protein n=1 Tax=Alterirhizorhabdus solaris TaxID=2529389 RepID=A0A558R7A7_9SPHN|nr:dienelactone hydrolase family protein [Sphingomonas solaris]TVV75273.1 dienelactone hydrolase family protein [Sphingomonas solaris]
MTDETIRAKAIALYDRFTHGTQDRRSFMAELTAVAGGTVAANALLASIAASPAAAAIVPAGDPRLKTATVRWPAAGGRTLSGYRAAPAGAKGRLPAVIVIHENRGLTEHIRDVARRVALAGFVAVAPDFLTVAGGTPTDEDKARTMIGALDLAATTADAVATVAWLRGDKTTNGKVGAVGFCWGGALTDRLAVAAGTALTAGVPYYGPAPAPAEAGKVKAAMLLHYAGLDDRVNATGLPWAEALKKAGVPVESFVYPGVNHAFNNDTAVGRYDAAAAKLAWDRTIAFLHARLG